MRTLSALILLLLSLSTPVAQGKAGAQPGLDRLRVRNQRIVLVRTGPMAVAYPERKRAVVNYPIITGLANREVLLKVKSIIQLKNIFDYSLADYRNDTWLDEFNYQVNYNQNYIFDITFTQRGTAAYPDEQSKHFAINLKNGSVLTASDVFVSNKFATLAGLVDERLKSEVSEIKQQWQSKLEPEEFKNIVDALDLQKFEVQNLDDFSIGSKGITFLYDSGFPHVVKALEPKGRYFFSYSELDSFIKREGMLRQFLPNGLE